MNNLYRKASFLVSAPNLRFAPADSGREIAFAGRSNAGKSSAINVITAQTGLARTSKTPGRTQQLVFFQLDGQRRLVDLPGYGYANVPRSVQEQWKQAMENYFFQRTSLFGVFLIMDIRHPMTELDQQMIECCNGGRRLLHVLLTKSDKLSRGAAKGVQRLVEERIRTENPEASVQLFSALKKSGVDEAHAVLDAWFGIAQDRSG